MSLHKFQLNEQHIALIKALIWEKNDLAEMVGPTIDPLKPFGNYDIINDIGLILCGPPVVTRPDQEDEATYTDEQITEFKKLYSELSMALDIVMFTGKFEPGNYRTKTYVRDWIKK